MYYVTYRVTMYALRILQLKDWNKTRLCFWISCRANMTKRRDVGTSDALVKLILRHWNHTFF